MDIEKRLLSLQDLGYKKFHEGLTPTKYEIIGVRIPTMRSIAKELAPNYKKLLKTIPNSYYECVLLKGLILFYAKIDAKEYFGYMDDFVNLIDNWAICDTTIGTKKEITKELDYVWIKVKEYTSSKKEFIVRAGIILIMSYFMKSEKYSKEIFKILNEIKNQEYYVKMGIAWLLASMYKFQTHETYNYLKNNKLDNWTHNKAIQKIQETSMNEDDKLKAKKLKR